MNAEMKNDMLKLGLILLIITAVAGVILSLSHSITKGPIDEAKIKASSGPDVANAVIPGSQSIEIYEDDDLVNKIKEANEYFVELRVCKDASGKELGYGIRTISPVKGYKQPIEMYVGLSLDGNIVGMKVLEHKETAGLGSKIETPKFQGNYIGKNADTQLDVVIGNASKDNEIAALSGATYSSKAMTSAVNNATAIFNEYLKK